MGLDMYFLVSNRDKFLIGWSAKVGCTAMKRWYSEALNLGLKNETIHETIGYGKTPFTNVDLFPPKHYNDYKKICIIRNPFSRLVSGYVNKYVIENDYERYFSTFEEFVGLLLKDRFYAKINRHHFTPQTSEAFSKYVRRKWSWDLVVDVEFLSHEITRINRIVSKDVNIGHPNVTMYDSDYHFDKPAYLMKADEIIRKIPPYQSFYNKELVKKVRAKYTSDFLYFRKWGFEFKDPTIYK
jgi:hypothetical protein